MFDWITDPVSNAFASILGGIGEWLSCLIPRIFSGALWVVDWGLVGLLNLLPETPENFHFSNIYSQMGTMTPILGSAEIAEIFTTVAGLLSILAIWKIIKLLPFIG